MTDLRKAAEMALESWEFFFSQAHPEIVDLMYGDDWAAVAKEKTEALRQALAQSKQEPVAWVLNRELFWPSEYEIISEDGDNAIPLYTAPPKRAWVGLTDEEIKEYKWMGQDVIAVIKEIQATLKEKNT